jgi:hypothetical protein
LQLKEDYEAELDDATNINGDYYSDYTDPDRIEYCESKSWCEGEDPLCAMSHLNQQNPETKKCNNTRVVAESVQEVEDWYETEKKRLSNPNAEEYLKQQAVASRLQPQYEEYLAKCQP